MNTSTHSAPNAGELNFEQRVKFVEDRYNELVSRKNYPLEGNGIFHRWKYPVVTADIVPPTWRYDYNPQTNPYFMERIGVNATLNAGAIKLSLIHI